MRFCRHALNCITRVCFEAEGPLESDSSTCKPAFARKAWSHSDDCRSGAGFGQPRDGGQRYPNWPFGDAIPRPSASGISDGAAAVAKRAPSLLPIRRTVILSLIGGYLALS